MLSNKDETGRGCFCILKLTIYSQNKKYVGEIESRFIFNSSDQSASVLVSVYKKQDDYNHPHNDDNPHDNPQDYRKGDRKAQVCKRLLKLVGLTNAVLLHVLA